MGLHLPAIEFLLYEKLKGINFSKLATLGRQNYYLDRHEIKKASRDTGLQIHRDDTTDSFFNYLGAKELEFIDNSKYEGASVIHDLNFPIPSQLKERYDCLIDGGALEHIFNFPVALKNCMEMVAVGGHLILITPWHNFSGHGFYQFSPELFYRCLSPENGYQIETMFMNEKRKWFQITDPSLINQRVEYYGEDQILLFITARRINEAEIFKKWPQQSDYATAWRAKEISKEKVLTKTTIKEKLIEVFPMLESLREIWQKYKKRRSSINWIWKTPVDLNIYKT